MKRQIHEIHPPGIQRIDVGLRFCSYHGMSLQGASPQPTQYTPFGRLSRSGRLGGGRLRKDRSMKSIARNPTVDVGLRLCPFRGMSLQGAPSDTSSGRLGGGRLRKDRSMKSIRPEPNRKALGCAYAHFEECLCRALHRNLRSTPLPKGSAAGWVEGGYEMTNL